MQSKPEGFGTEYADIADEPRRVLDVGAGSGDIARRLVDFVEQVDAVSMRRFQQDVAARCIMEWINASKERRTHPVKLLRVQS
jgi:hypothetical protein